MGFSFIPKEHKFFELFNKQADNVYAAGKYFNELVTTGTFNEDTVAKMHRLEHEGDLLAHEISDTLNRTFITPFDREDIFDLSNHLDNVIDSIDAITKRMVLYKLTTPDTHMKQFAVIIEQSCRALKDAIKHLGDPKSRRRIMEYCLEINKLENNADQVREFAIGELFDKCSDPIKVIKWKEMYEIAESTVDICEHTAKNIQSVLVKQG
ncbi:MAG: DUF47 family protein [Pseudomonadota bacterium]